MKAITQTRYGGTDVLELADVNPPTAGPGEVLVEVRAAGVDAGVWHLMTGLPYLVRPAFGLRGPRVSIRGREFAGVIAAVGAAVDEFAPGDEVLGTGDGAFAEYLAVGADRLVRKPAELTFEQAAALPISGITALQALRDVGQLEAGQHVLVIGAGGGVGTFAVQLAKAMGATVTGLCSTGKVDLVRLIGADHVIDYTREDATDGRRRFDLIVDAGGNRPLRSLRRALTPTGTLVIVGGDNAGKLLGGVDRWPRAALLSLFVKQRLRGFIAAEKARDIQRLVEYVRAGTLTPVIDRTYPLGEAAAAIDQAQHGRARGKVVVVV